MQNAFHRLLLFLILVGVTLYSPILNAAGDTAVGTLHLSGIVPTYFSVTATGITDAMDLSPKSKVVLRSVGLLHFKFNENVQTITISSNTASGGPEDPAHNPYPFGNVGGFQVAIKPGCASVDPAFNAPFTLTQVGTDVHSNGSANLVANGIEEDCILQISYWGTNANLPLSGLYSIDVTVTMVAP